jgi:VWFA-related protein
MKMIPSCRVGLSVSFVLLVGALAGAQNSNSNSDSKDQPPPVFRSETRQVLVDVAVTDRSGHFVPGLKPGDFTVLEGGKPQKIVAFGMHLKPAVPEKPAPPLQLPPNQYTNYGIADPERPITVVLLDTLNTQVQDQAYTKKQMIEFLRSLPSGERVALFALGTRLRMIQGFTGSSDTLVSAATMLLRRDTSPLMTSEPQRQGDDILSSNLQVNAGPASTGPSNATAGADSPNASILAPIVSALQGIVVSEQHIQQMQRMDFTLAALQSLARAVSAYPGRKNLLWLSAEFPIRFGPDFSVVNTAGQQAQVGLDDQSNRVQDLRVNVPLVRETAALLTAAQIAAYPIDIRGTINPGTGMDISTGVQYGSVVGLGNNRDRTAVRQTTMEWDDHEAMTDIARETGGKAFYGSNDIKAALAASMEEGENYYTIAYAPENHHWDGKYRKIEIKCSQEGTKLSHRRGYYAVEDTGFATLGKVADSQVALLFTTAMHPEAPTSTMMLLKVQVLPPDVTHKTVRIDYAINSQDVDFSDAPQNTKHLALDLMVVAWDKNGKNAAESLDQIDTSVSLSAYQSVMRSYIPAHQELEVKPGSYTLRLGVVDRNTRKIGTLDVPLTIPEFQASSK